MKAAVCRAFGSFSNVSIQDVPRPDLLPGTIRIRVAVAAANPPDALMPQGKYQVRPQLPFAIGLECAGTVTEVADDVEGLKSGDRVMTYAGQGCFAEEVVVRAELVYPMPSAMSFEIGAGFALAFGTAYHALVDRGKVIAGETVVVLGAAGGLGLCAVQMAKALGARVIAVASIPEKLEICSKYGADACVPAGVPDLKHALREANNGSSVDVIHDTVGGPLTLASLRSLRPFGRHLIVGYSSGEIPQIPANYVLLKQVEVIGVSFRQCAQNTPDVTKRALRALSRLWEEGKLNPPISKIHPFERFGDAVDALSSRATIGKHLVRIA